MKATTLGLIAAVLVPVNVAGQPPATQPAKESTPMELGAFSVSLTVKDLGASVAFYRKLGFEVVGGDASQNWQILRNGTTTIGLFHGMFEKNILTFNPGWGPQANNLATFTDVREIQKMLDERGVAITTRADDSTGGPASLILVDPDGNPILIDQHVPRPK